MAIDFLSIPPASTECERCFSLVKLTVGSQRHGLKEDTVNYIESYRQWKRSERQQAKAPAVAGGVAAGVAFLVP